MTAACVKHGPELPMACGDQLHLQPCHCRGKRGSAVVSSHLIFKANKASGGEWRERSG